LNYQNRNKTKNSHSQNNRTENSSLDSCRLCDFLQVRLHVGLRGYPLLVLYPSAEAQISVMFILNITLDTGGSRSWKGRERGKQSSASL